MQITTRHEKSAAHSITFIKIEFWRTIKLCHLKTIARVLWGYFLWPNLTKITNLRNLICFQVFYGDTNTKAGAFKLLRFEERFQKAPFSWRNSVDGKPNRRKKAAFSNFKSCHKIVWFFSGLVRNNFDYLNLGVHSFTNNIGAVTCHRFPCSGRRYHSDNR